MAHPQAQAAQSPAPSQSSPQAPDQSQEGQSAQSPHSEDISPDSDFGGEDEVAQALADVGYTPGHHNLEEGEDEEETRKPAEVAPAEKPAQTEVNPSSEQRDTVKPSALASFHRAQKEFFQRQQAFEGEKAQLLKIKAQIDNAKVDRIAALEAMGYEGPNAVKEFLQGLAEDNGRMTPERRELMEMKKWRQELEAKEQAQQQQQAQSHHQARIQAKLDQIKANVQNRLKSPEFEGTVLGVRETDHQVMLEMDKLATQSGEMPDIEVAIRNVEKNYTEVLEELAKNPGAMRFFEDRLRQSKSGNTVAAQSKQREKSRTIGRDTRSPGTQVAQENSSSGSADSELEDAVRWVRQFSKR